MTLNQLKLRLQAGLGSFAEAEVVDLTGTQNHYQIDVSSEAFVGKSVMEQHRMVMALFEKEVRSGEIHALSLKTRPVGSA